MCIRDSLQTNRLKNGQYGHVQFENANGVDEAVKLAGARSLQRCSARCSASRSSRCLSALLLFGCIVFRSIPYYQPENRR